MDAQEKRSANGTLLFLKNATPLINKGGIAIFLTARLRTVNPCGIGSGLARMSEKGDVLFGDLPF